MDNRPGNLLIASAKSATFQPMNLLALTYDQLVDHFQVCYGHGAFHAAALYRAFYASARLKIARMPEFAASRVLSEKIDRDLDRSLPQLTGRIEANGVTKLQFRLRDGLAIETVLIPMANHTTVCVSSQVGCRMGCRFCETGRMGLLRQLSTDEIVAQVYMATVCLGHNVRNVVFMGMGEPLDNFDAVVQAIRVIEDQRGLNIAKRRMTVSTVGLVPGIERLGDLNWPRLKLAVSLNAADDTLRSALMPVNRRFNLDELKAALQSYPLARANVLFVEYVLIKGVNDRCEDACRLAQYVTGLPVRLNLIPYNPRRQSPFDAPSEQDVVRFHRRLIDLGLFVRLRTSKGAGIRAACGQLGGKQ